MLKTTTVGIAIPLTNELFFQASAIGNRPFQPFPWQSWQPVVSVPDEHPRWSVSTTSSATTRRAPCGAAADADPEAAAATFASEAMTETHRVLAENVKGLWTQTRSSKGVDMEVRTGEVACIVGPSGGGKSTFLRCIKSI